jgi:hypothetical protein
MPVPPGLAPERFKREFFVNQLLSQYFVSLFRCRCIQLLQRTDDLEGKCPIGLGFLGFPVKQSIAHFLALYAIDCYPGCVFVIHRDAKNTLNSVDTVINHFCISILSLQPSLDFILDAILKISYQ